MTSSIMPSFRPAGNSIPGSDLAGDSRFRPGVASAFIWHVPMLLAAASPPMVLCCRVSMDTKWAAATSTTR